MIDLRGVLKSLSGRRPVFHSEADFQLALGMEIERQYPDAAVRLEYKPFPGERVHLDMWVYHDGRWLAVELKYKTRPVQLDWHGERFELVAQAAQDLSGYDVWKDVARVERICSEFDKVDGYVVLLTNDDALWRRVSETESSVGAAFRLFEGRTAAGTLYWASHAGQGTMRTREAPLDLGSSYHLHWVDYSRLGPRTGETLRLLVIPVERPDRTAIAAPTPVRISGSGPLPVAQTQPRVDPQPTRGRRSKYAPIGDLLRGSQAQRVEMTYSQIEELVGEPLPPSAHNHRAAWANSSQNTWPLMRVVRAAGWRVDSVQMGSKVVFVRQ